MIRHAALLLTTTLCLTACGEFRGMPSLEVTLPEMFAQAPEVAASEKPAPLSQDWWKQTDDKVLVGLLERVEKQNLSIEQAQFRLLAARESARSLDYLPTLGVTTDAQYNRLIEGDFAINNVGFAGAGGGQQKTTGFYNARLDSSWELPLWGQYGAASDIDKRSLAYAEADLASVRANVMAEAVRLYAEMRGFQQQRLAHEKMVSAQEKITEYQFIKHKAGLIPDSDLASATRSLLEAKGTLQTTLKNEVAARQQLAALMGQAAPEKEWEAPADVPSITLPELGDTPVDVLRNRPDIRRAEASVLREAAQLELAKADRYPRITLGGNLSQLDNLTGSPLPGKTIQLTGTPAISIPLFDWGKRLAAAKAQDAKLSETASAYRETVVNAMTEVESFLSAAEAAKKNKEQSTESAALERKNQEQAALLFTQGLTDGITAENAHIMALQAEISALQTHVEQISRIAALTKALGGGIPAPTISTNEQTP
jgi:NodT family efflux transporter outer membrane factor (OMF) lipoprotein